NHSNGCIATVDVSYPSMPLFLLYNTELVKGMMRPILKFARMPVWTFDFAPHDAGTYPACCGQVYALKQNDDKYHARYIKDGFAQTHFPIYSLPASFAPYDFRYQMPVEECANMLIMFAACYKQDGDISFFKQNADLCGKWVEYLIKYGLRPEDQLCTDDFAGHLKNNLNLSVKAAVGIGAYALLQQAAGENADNYFAIAREYANELTRFCLSFEHSPLTWESGKDTFSLKYNLAFDKILGLRLFPQELLEKETAYYIKRTEKFGVPLDSRKGYTKSDWICWAASLTDDKNKAAALIRPVAEFLKCSPERMPFTDWYETSDGRKCAFTARSVQGGCFILLMNENLQ
ncbi:MAG: glutaminase domain-containing protein, partial [Candidatus Scatosoma sp.]